MKKIFLSFLTLLLLGGSLAWGAVNLTGTVTIEATEEEKTQLSGLKLVVGLYTVTWPKDVSMLEELSPSVSSYTYTNMWSGKAFFGIGSATDMAYNEASVAQDWIIVLETGGEGNPIMDMPVSGDVTINITIKRKGSGGGGDDDPDTPKATLLGKVLAGNDCLDGVTVAISNGSGYTAQTTTQTDASKYDDKVGCSAGYEFADLANGTYTLTYSKSGYTTQTQDIEITEAAEKIAPAVTLEVAPVNYVFYGALTYLNADNETVYVQGATVTAYNGAGEDATVLGTPVQTNGNADWYMSLSCLPGVTVYFGAAHNDIEVAERTAVQATDPTGEGIEVSIACTPKTPVVVDDSVNLTLEVNETAMGTVEGARKYKKGTQVTIKATANEGYVFEAWKTQDGETEISKEAEYRFVLNSDSTLKAFFAVKPVDPPVVVDDSATLTLEVNETAMGTVEGARKYKKGTQVTIKAIANEGYVFEAWKTQDGETEISKEAEYRFVLNSDSTLKAFFAVKPVDPPVVVNDSVTLTLEVNETAMGTVEGARKYKKGTQVTIKATANEGYVFEAWKTQDGETEISKEAEYSFVLNSDSTLKAFFAVKPVDPPVVKDSVELKLEVNNAAMGTVTGAKKYEKGSQVMAKATPNEGYEFKGWQEYGETVSIENPYTFTINANRTLTAVFEAQQTPPEPPVVKDSVELKLEVNNAAMGTVQGAGKYEKGKEVVINAIANEGYEFRGWMEGDMMVSMTAEHTLVLDADRLLTAMFAAKPVDPVVKDSVELTLEVNDADMGSVEGGGKYEKGTEVTVRATANEGYVFVAWMNNGGMVSKTAEYKFTLVSDSTLTAVFAENTANEDREQANWNVYAEGRTMVLQSNTACRYEVYAVSGKKLEQGRSHAGEYRIAVNNSGMYIVRRITSKGASVKKVMIR